MGRTDHGPIITPAIPHEQRAISLRWSAYDPGANSIPLFDVDSASNWTEFRNVLGRWWGPSLNVIYADDQGHIGYQSVGFIPIRDGGISTVPATAGTHEWQGFVPFDQMPSAEDPVNGILATANSRIAPDGYPYQLTLEWAAPYRNERIWKWLAGKNKLTPADMLTLQGDIYSSLDQELGRRYAYAIDHTTRADNQLRQAADLLRSWDGVMNSNSARRCNHRRCPPGILADGAETEARRRLAPLRLGLKKPSPKKRSSPTPPRNGFHPATPIGMSSSPQS